MHLRLLPLLAALAGACGGTPKAADTLESAASYTAMAAEVVAERAEGSLPHPFTADALGAAADGLDAIATHLDSAQDLSTRDRAAAARDARARARDARALASRPGRLPGEAARAFSESSERFEAMSKQSKDAQSSARQGGS